MKAATRRRPPPVLRDGRCLNGVWDRGGRVPVYGGEILHRRTYQRRVNVPAEWQGRIIRLEFAAVNYVADVFVNDVLLGRHVGGFIPFDLDVTDHVTCGESFALRVEVGGMLGKVDKMSLVSTSLLTLDNQLIVIPNNKIWGDVIKNVTAQTVRRVDMVFGISHSDDIPKAERILEDILTSHELVLKDPAPMVRLHTLGASSVDFVVRPWVNVDDYWDVYWDVTRTVKLRFDEEGVSIPFPQRDVHVYHENSPIPATG